MRQRKVIVAMKLHLSQRHRSAYRCRICFYASSRSCKTFEGCMVALFSWEKSHISENYSSKQLPNNHVWWFEQWQNREVFSSVDTCEGLFVFFSGGHKNLEFSSIVSLWLAGGLGFQGSFWQQRSTRGSRFPLRFCYSPNRVGALTHGPHGPTPIGGCVFETTRPTSIFYFLGVFMRFWEITNNSRMMTKLGRRSTWCKSNVLEICWY